MNRNRNMKIDFRINEKHDHYIEPKHGTKVLTRATKPRKKGLARKTAKK